MWQARLQRQALAIRPTCMTGAGMAAQRRFAAAAGVLVVATLAGCGAAQSGSGALPGVTGGGVRALWQGPSWEDLTISGGLVLGVQQDGHTAQVHAVSALTGAPAWTMFLPASLPQVLGLVQAGSVVVVEAGRGLTDPAGGAVVTEYVAVDVTTGHQVWTAPVRSGSNPLPDEIPPIAAAGNLLLTGDPAGAVTAREAATGAVAWRDPRPAACRAAPTSGMEGNAGLGIAADGSLAVASFDCGPAVIVQRLDATTGRPLWSWTSPAAYHAAVHLPVTAAARDGGVVLLTGAIGPQSAAARFTARLPHPYPWPARLGPADGTSIVLALDAADGHPRWSELGGQQVMFAPAEGAVCELVSAGLECRDDTTGAATLPDLMTGQNPDGGPPMADISGSVAIVTAELFRAGEVTLRIVKIRGGATAAQARLAIGVKGYGGADLRVVPAAAGPLPGGATLVLISRVDLPGYPVLALRIPPRA
jgi:outer membrane protein assembly factor BamB